MSDKPISDLRRRMIADMTVRSFSDKTQHEYIRQIATFARFLGRSPDTASGDDIRRFQLAQVEQGAQPPKMNSQASALRFFLTVTIYFRDATEFGGKATFMPKWRMQFLFWRTDPVVSELRQLAGLAGSG